MKRHRPSLANRDTSHTGTGHPSFCLKTYQTQKNQYCIAGGYTAERAWHYGPHTTASHSCLAAYKAKYHIFFLR